MIILHGRQVVAARLLNVAEQVFELGAVAKLLALFRTREGIVQTASAKLRESEIELRFGMTRVEIRHRLELVNRFGKFTVGDQEFCQALAKNHLVFGSQLRRPKQLQRVMEIGMRSQLRFQVNKTDLRIVRTGK